MDANYMSGGNHSAMYTIYQIITLHFKYILFYVNYSSIKLKKIR